MSARHRRSIGAIAPVAAAAVTLAPGVAFAHSVVVDTTPAQGASVAAPRTITVTFNEDIRTQFAYTRLVGPGGQVPTTTKVTGPDLVATPGSPLAAGAYTLSYRVASEDTHPVSGTVRFTVRAGATSPTAVPSTTASTVAPTSGSAAATTSTAAPAATSASPSGAAEPATTDEASAWTSWPAVTAMAFAVAILGWFAGRAARRRR